MEGIKQNAVKKGGKKRIARKITDGKTDNVEMGNINYGIRCRRAYLRLETLVLFSPTDFPARRTNAGKIPHDRDLERFTFPRGARRAGRQLEMKFRFSTWQSVE